MSKSNKPLSRIQTSIFHLKNFTWVHQATPLRKALQSAGRKDLIWQLRQHSVQQLLQHDQEEKGPLKTVPFSRGFVTMEIRQQMT